MKLHLLFILSTFLLITACQKNSDNFEPYPLDGNTEFIYEELGLDVQSKLINSNEEISLNYEHAKINISAGSIDGSNEEKIMVHLTESRNALEVYLSNISNTIGESFLMPSYYFNLELSNEAQIKEEQPLTIFVEIESLKGLSLFEYNVATGNWDESSSDFEIQESIDESGTNVNGALITVDQVGNYILGSRVNFSSMENRDICVSLSGEYNSNNSLAFVKLKDNLVVPLERIEQLGTFCRLNQLPIEQEFTLVVLTNIRVNQYEIYVEEFQGDIENVNIDAVLLPEEIENIKIILQDL